MANRKTARRGRSKESTVSNANETQTTNKESNRMALSQDQIAELLAGGRTRGAGTAVIEEFLASGEAGEEVDLTTGHLAGKSPGQAYNALNNARKRTKTDDSGNTVLANPSMGKVRVMKKNVGDKENEEWHVFLINTDLVEMG